MPLTAGTDRFADFAAHIAALPTAGPSMSDLLVPTFRLHQDGDLAIYYAPFDYVNTAAKIALIGITPGQHQMRVGYAAAARSLRCGLPLAEAGKRAKYAASFDGPMRRNLVGMLDGLGMADALGLASTSALFGDSAELAHMTSAIRYPAFIAGQNYTGHSPRLLTTPLLRSYVYGPLRDELRQTREALLVPLGDAVSRVLRALIDDGHVEEDRCLLGFPHPSGANGHRISQYDERRSALSAKANDWFGSRASTVRRDK